MISPARIELAYLSTYWAGAAAARSNPRFKELSQHLVAKGKNKKLALIAVARRLLILIYALWKNNTHYDPDNSRLLTQYLVRWHQN
jgi:hypothetical protein